MYGQDEDREPSTFFDFVEIGETDKVQQMLEADPGLAHATDTCVRMTVCVLSKNSKQCVPIYGVFYALSPVSCPWPQPLVLMTTHTMVTVDADDLTHRRVHRNGTTALLIASRCGHADIIRSLLDSG